MGRCHSDSHRLVSLSGQRTTPHPSNPVLLGFEKAQLLQIRSQSHFFQIRNILNTTSFSLHRLTFLSSERSRTLAPIHIKHIAESIRSYFGTIVFRPCITFFHSLVSITRSACCFNLSGTTSSLPTSISLAMKTVRWASSALGCGRLKSHASPCEGGHDRKVSILSKRTRVRCFIVSGTPGLRPPILSRSTLFGVLASAKLEAGTFPKLYDQEGTYIPNLYFNACR